MSSRLIFVCLIFRSSKRWVQAIIIRLCFLNFRLFILTCFWIQILYHMLSHVLGLNGCSGCTCICYSSPLKMGWVKFEIDSFVTGFLRLWGHVIVRWSCIRHSPVLSPVMRLTWLWGNRYGQTSCIVLAWYFMYNCDVLLLLLLFLVLFFQNTWS